MNKSWFIGFAVAITICWFSVFSATEAFGQRGDRDDERRGGRGDRGDRGDRGGDDNEDRRRGRGGDDNDRGGRENRFRNFDPTDFLKRLDTNNSGSLEPSEMRGRSGDFVKRLGFNTDRPVAISAISGKVNRERDQRLAQERKEEFQAGLTIPGFGNTEREELESVPEFGGASTAAGDGPTMTSLAYSEEEKRDADRSMERYDRNNNGVLEKEEYERGRWGNPSPEEADLNHDGVLTREELMYRYRMRSQASNRDQTPRDDDNRGDSNRRDSRTPNRFSNRDNSSSRERSSSPRDRGSSFRTTSSSETRSTAGRMNQYVKDLIEGYDANKDGQLDDEEISKMRQQPPKSADTNKDGKFSHAELMAHYDNSGSDRESDPAKAETSMRTSVRSNRFSGRNRGRDSGRETTAVASEYESEEIKSRLLAKGATSVFLDKDLNKDGQIQMHEYADEWTSDLLSEFKAVDVNGDGIITPEEWRNQ